MKFGQTLLDSVYSEWKFFYADYQLLKQTLKNVQGGDFSDEDEAQFIELLQTEIDKVFDFKEMKSGEITRHVQYCENLVKTGKDKVDVEDVRKDIDKISFQLEKLASFIRLNQTAFLKIVKKHDKHTRYILRPMFMNKLKSKSSLETIDVLIYRLGLLYRLLVSKGESPLKDTQGIDFMRKTAKYWIHPDNVMDLKCLILRHLPVFIFNSSSFDPSISSVYFDNATFDAYRSRIQRDEGAEAIRCRWYGRQSPTEVFVERKTHREDWTGELSVKSRFKMKEKHVNDYIHGNYTMSKVFEKLKLKGKSDSEVENLRILSTEIQESIVKKQLKPVIRTFYNRTAFQFPNDARVRISIDTDLCMIKEKGDNWRRLDVEWDFPFSNLSDSEICRFPYAIMEVKLQIDHGEEPPTWIQQLVKSHIVEEVPKFSKYIHGCAALYAEKIDVVPYWISQTDVDIRTYQRDKVYHEAEEESFKIDICPERLQTSDFREKRIAIPVRVEPKVYFANERTFLSWIHFSMYLGGISSALLGLGSAKSQIPGGIFAIVSILIAIYALILYYWRGAKIRSKDVGPYDDRIGPFLLVIIFVFAVSVSLFFGSK